MMVKKYEQRTKGGHLQRSTTFFFDEVRLASTKVSHASLLLPFTLLVLSNSSSSFSLYADPLVWVGSKQTQVLMLNLSGSFDEKALSVGGLGIFL